jgi:hypothetical protein
VKHKLEGYEQGIVPSWYFAPIEKKFEMQEYRAVRKPIYMREFPTGKIRLFFSCTFFSQKYFPNATLSFSFEYRIYLIFSLA